MGNYKVVVSIEIKECAEEMNEFPIKKQDGCFEFKISGEDAISIDNCEQALLRTNYAAVRDALSVHLTEVSKKKPLNK